ncbi:MAG: peptidase M48 family protein [Micavibrio sp.]|nr:peptidase M48 family protein [Micavibrio sp.]|tara:strand:+ start:96810 stop:98282 length:1473 start_codon:yes stop_codon:yes gene_type:complete
MTALCTKRYGTGKTLLALIGVSILAGCSTNAATGERQFTGLLSPEKEKQIGAEQHDEALKAFGGIYADKQLQNYVSEVGQRLAQYAENTGVTYKFYLLDSPVVNAFAAPGGYIYVTRGLLYHANSEAELAGVLAHEIGHITGRHSAERYSTGVLTQIGAQVASAAIGSQAASQALGLGSNLFLSSYSRGQENESDELGVRYLHKAGYDVYALSRFLQTLQMQSALEAKTAGRTQNVPSFFSTHPNTADRVTAAASIAARYGKNDAVVNRDRHMALINGITYGDAASQGFQQGNMFYHPELGFKYAIPSGYNVQNQPSQVVASGNDGGVLILDNAANTGGLSPAAFIQNVWLKGKTAPAVENYSINGMNAATTSFKGSLNNKEMTIRIIAIAYDPKTFYRFQVAYPPNASASTINALKSATESFAKLSPNEVSGLTPLRIVTRKAGLNNSVASWAGTMPFENYKEERFRVLNGMVPSAPLRTGETYKLITK